MLLEDAIENLAQPPLPTQKIAPQASPSTTRSPPRSESFRSQSEPVDGDGPERERLEQLAESLDVHFQFEGLVPPDGVDEYYHQSSAFVLTSTEGEGLPNIVLEAMSWGLPVVATDSRGLLTVVDDGRNGYVVPMRSLDAIADRVQILPENEDLRRSTGESGRMTIKENYSWDRIVAELEGIYSRLENEPR